MTQEKELNDALADRLRQIGIEIAEIRQYTVKYGQGVSTPYGELWDAEGLVMGASRRLRKLAGEGGL